MGPALHQTSADAIAAEVVSARLHAACLGLASERPNESSITTFARSHVYLLAIGLSVVGALLISPWFAACIGSLGLAFFTVGALARAASAGAILAPRRQPALVLPANVPLYSVLCPLYREPNALPNLVEALRRLRYPRDRLQIVLVMEADDSETVAAARLHAPDFDHVLVPPCMPRTKPKALNFALSEATGEYVVVYDAEDSPDPDQLLAALDAFQRSHERQSSRRRC
jgi:glycosyltransferase XagB